MEIDPQEGPLALHSVRDTLNSANMDGDERGRSIWDQDGISFSIDIDLTWHQIPRVLLLSPECLNLLHIFDFLLGFVALNFSRVKPNLQISLLELVKSHLVALPVF